MQIGTDPPLGGVSIARLQQGETRFPGIQIFEQSANEQLLSRSLAAEGTEVLWRHRLIDLIDDTGQTEGQVVALLDGPPGSSASGRAGVSVPTGPGRPSAASWIS